MKSQIQNLQKNGLISVFTKVMFAIAIVMFASCDKDDDNAKAPVVNTPSNSGSADITITAGGEEFKVVGSCGWAVAGGVNYIGARHSENSNRIFEAAFNITSLPTETTTYQLVEDSSGGNPTEIEMFITEVRQNGFTEWRSKNTSGELTLVVNGNEITANLAGITLYPSISSTNPGVLNNSGPVTGTIKFYR